MVSLGPGVPRVARLRLCCSAHCRIDTSCAGGGNGSSVPSSPPPEKPGSPGRERSEWPPSCAAARQPKGQSYAPAGHVATSSTTAPSAPTQPIEVFVDLSHRPPPVLLLLELAQVTVVGGLLLLLGWIDFAAEDLHAAEQNDRRSRPQRDRRRSIDRLLGLAAG